MASAQQGTGTGADAAALQAQCDGEADALFARLGVDDVRRVVAQTRADVAARSDALRAFVGEHHQDLVRVAEAVVAVADVAGGVLAALGKNNEQDKDKDDENEGNNSEGSVAEKGAAASTQREVCAAARLLRVVVCAPERVAALADRGEYLAAALAYHRACGAHAALAATATPAARCVAAAVPLAARQWAALAAVPPALCARSGAALAERAGTPPLTPARAAAALGALLVLRQPDPEALVQEYLAHRTDAVLLPCSGSGDGDGGEEDDDAGAALGTVAERFVATLVLADALFCGSAGADAEAGGKRRPALMERVVARVVRARALLPAAVGAAVAALGTPLVAAPALERLCAAWRAAAQTQVRAAVRARLARVASLAALRRAADAVGRRLAACAPLRREPDVWAALFAAPFEERAAALVAAHTRALTDLATALVGTLAAPTPADRHEDDDEDEDENNDDNNSVSATATVEEEEQEEPWNAPGIPDLDAIARLQDTTTPLAAGTAAPVAAFVAALDAALAAVHADVAAAADSARVGGVRGAAADGVAAVVAALAAALAARVRDPACPRGGVLRCAHAARAARTALPALARLGTLCGAAPDPAPLARVHGAARATWLQRTLARPLAAFRAALAAVPWAARATARAVRGTFAAPPGTGADAPAMPAFLTPCLAALLGDVAAAVVRAHGDTLPRAAACLLARTLSDGVLAAYAAVLGALAAARAPVAPETAVQLWFDVYAVGELFAARTVLADPHDAAAAALAAALQPADSSSEVDDAWPARVAQTLAAAQALLDPVERGYFRPHMRAAVARALQRSALVYALYSPALGSPTGTTGTASSDAATALPCARVAGRFALLPSTSSIPVAAAALTAPWPVPSPLLPRHAGSTAPAPSLAASAPAQRTQRDDALLMAVGSFF